MFRFVVPIVSAVFISLASGPVKADTFHFSFNNLAANGGGTVMGTVTLNATDTAATSLTVDSNTAGFGLGQYVGSPSPNSFTVVSGQITSANFLSKGPTAATCCTFDFITVTVNGVTRLEGGLANNTLSVTTSLDSLVTFTPVNAVPLPATLPLFATGLGALGLLGWRRKRKVAS